ncbi:MAG TPA: hypothetical protein DCE42_17235 [Myxococcales bacterium]|nr:hypothetical protein [Deltaproteobacteria bacterium]MBU49882.1 hypothetical protein [Deltaproteobacteria bacterium]HAA56513.1 hypothetical protein [Myxococcales bacterium]|tara:strand:- start:2372 stop:2557 length:186 start_codon:yes stop_codon:yes gene_type:complete
MLFILNHPLVVMLDALKEYGVVEDTKEPHGWPSSEEYEWELYSVGFFYLGDLVSLRKGIGL